LTAVLKATGLRIPVKPVEKQAAWRGRAAQLRLGLFGTVGGEKRSHSVIVRYHQKSQRAVFL